MTATLTPPATAARPGILAAASGIVLAVLNFGPTLPERPADVTAETARAYLTENATALRTFGIVMALSAAVLLVFVAHLRTLMDAEGERLPADVAFGSGVVIAVWLIVSGAMGSIGGFDISAELPDAFAVQYVGIAAVGDMIGSATTVLKGTLMLAVSVAALRTRFLPRWLAWFGVVLGVMAIGGTFTFTDNPVTDALFYAGLFGFALWPLPAGIVLTVRAVRARRA